MKRHVDMTVLYAFIITQHRCREKHTCLAHIRRNHLRRFKGSLAHHGQGISDSKKVTILICKYFYCVRLELQSQEIPNKTRNIRRGLAHISKNQMDELRRSRAPKNK